MMSKEEREEIIRELQEVLTKWGRMTAVQKGGVDLFYELLGMLPYAIRESSYFRSHRSFIGVELKIIRVESETGNRDEEFSSYDDKYLSKEYYAGHGCPWKYDAYFDTPFEMYFSPEVYSGTAGKERLIRDIEHINSLIRVKEMDRLFYEEAEEELEKKRIRVNPGVNVTRLVS